MRDNVWLDLPVRSELLDAYVDAYDREMDRMNERPKGNMRDKSVYVEEMSTKNAAIVVLHVDYRSFEGTARAHPDDTPGSPTIGRNLALSRAFKKAGRYFRKEAEKELKHHEERKKRNDQDRGFAAPRNPYNDDPRH